MKINLKNLKSQSGITLSSLIVTIIVMMILSVASVSILSGNTGILDETEFAVNEANKQVIIDEVKIMVSKFGVMWDGNETLRDYVVNKLQSYEGGYKTETGGKITVNVNGYVTYVDKNGRKIVFEDEDGLKKLKIDENGNVMEVAYTPPPEGLKIGDTVKYEPTGSTYTWQGKYATLATISKNEYGNDVTADDVLLDSTPEEDEKEAGVDRIISWKVLNIDSDTGEIKLVPATQPVTEVKLQAANGYNNAVKLLNDACKELYSDTNNPEIEARSINIEDIEEAMDTTKLATLKSDSYLVLMKNANDDCKENGYIGKKQYPLIFERERKSVINGIEIINGLTSSQSPNDFIERADKSVLRDATTTEKATEGKITAKTSIKAYHTYYNLNISSNAKSSLHSGVICPKNQKYWVASRCINTYSDYCDFNLRSVNLGYMNQTYLFGSGGFNKSPARSLFPVVSLSSSLISKDSSNNWFVKQ